ncbi:TetR/AcrR family transcriptional regulator [Maricaulis sp.]|uniref:TetR/AcrR family transcriptional regulator n=1 Tax=Maricaulis sp. TaxID=1486257 RepID=UPI002602E78F|nr:TetR/AcrR family transcriptional regulator [Maricaulis sp.]
MTEANPTREKILRACWDLLEGGDTKVRMSDIAKTAGVSRQAVYLHFPSRAELLIATTRFIDEVEKVDERLARSRAATTGRERLDAYIDAWGNYIPRIYGVGRAMMAMMDGDEEAHTAWQGRMMAMRHGCEAAVNALDRDGDLVAGVSVEGATDALWMLLSVRNWEHLVQDRGWTQDAYIAEIKRLARASFVRA